MMVNSVKMKMIISIIVNNIYLFNVPTVVHGTIYIYLFLFGII